MFKATRWAALVLLAGMTLSTAAPALAAPAAPVTKHEVTSDEVIWVLLPGQCPKLPPDLAVAGVGERVTTMDTAFFDNGRFIIEWDETTTGSAADSNGEAYTFYSVDHWTAYTPGDGAQVQFRIYDLFLLQSPAMAAQNDYVLRSSFDWHWTFDADAMPFDVWPPTNLEKTTNYGDPVGDELEYVCDPL